MGRRTANTTESPSYDSFLDIVANLIGILVILIMVVGVRAKDAFVSAAAPVPVVAPEVIEPESIDTETPARQAASVEKDINRINRAMKQVEHEAEIRRKSRDTTYAMLTSLEQEIEQEKTKLDRSQREAIELDTELQQASSYLDQLDAQRQALENESTAPEVLPHVPTPLAKTVFGREEHFRLEGGRLSYVPWEKLIEQFQREARENIYKLKGVPQFTDEFGPIGGYRGIYRLKRVRRSLDTGGVTMTQEGVELDRILMVPIRDDLGEPTDRLFAAGSEFRSRLETWEPRKTTITVWVYPDSFEQFRKLKAELYQLGFMTAARPLPAGQQIGGSPGGTRSSAQ